MEQFLLQLPKRLAQEVRSAVANGEGHRVEMIAGADNKHFKFVLNGKEHPAKIANLPTILETHKTYDDNFLYKSGEIGQIFVVADKEEERQVLEQMEELSNGIAPPNTNVVKRKYEKTRRYTPFPKPEVARVEEELVKMIAPGPYEEVVEELVDYCDWMVDEDHPNGIIVTDELDLIRKHPEYLDLSSDVAPPSKQQKLLEDSRSASRNSDAFSALNTPIVTDAGSEAESHGGLESAQRSPAFAPTPSPALSPPGDDDQDVDDMEDDFLSGMEEKSSAPSQKAYLQDPAYQELLTKRDRLQKSVRDAERDVNEYSAKVNANSNIVVKNRFKQMMESAQAQRDKIAADLNDVLAQIRAMESS